MESEFVECIKQAELENNMALVIKGNGLKMKSEETKQEKRLSQLNEKRGNSVNS